MVDPGVVETIVQAGAVGLALVSLGILYQALRLISNHLVHVAELLGRVASTLDILVSKYHLHDKE